jgi:ribose 5-phosphate isomerase A
MTTLDPALELKRRAAEKAVEFVRDGMIVGLGTGSTAKLAVDAIGRRQREEGLRVTGVPTSEATAAQAKSLGIPLVDFSAIERIDLTIDGADAVKLGSLDLIKGLGGALLREKIVASVSDRMIVIVDGGKLATPFGATVPLPVEVARFGWQSTQRKLAGLGAATALRSAADGQPFVTDGGNYIVDCRFGAIDIAAALEQSLRMIVGVVETGLFIELATEVIVARDGGVEILGRS